MIRWVWAFVDRPAAEFEAGARFWTTVTGTTLSARRGERDEFATFLPPEGRGDAAVKLQGVLVGGGAHIDLEFDDFEAAVARVGDLGGTIVERNDAWAYAKSPSGYGLCVTAWYGATTVPAPFAAPDGTRSRLGQVCVDVAPSAFEAELAFWSGVSGLAVVPSRRFEQFSWLEHLDGAPVAMLFQRVGEERPTSAHLDMWTSDADATRAWHETLGAEFVTEQANWLVMRDPQGWEYCLIRRDPSA